MWFFLISGALLFGLGISGMVTTGLFPEVINLLFITRLGLVLMGCVWLAIIYYGFHHGRHKEHEGIRWRHTLPQAKSMILIVLLLILITILTPEVVHHWFLVVPGLWGCAWLLVSAGGIFFRGRPCSPKIVQENGNNSSK